MLRRHTNDSAPLVALSAAVSHGTLRRNALCDVMVTVAVGLASLPLSLLAPSAAKVRRTCAAGVAVLQQLVQRAPVDATLAHDAGSGAGRRRPPRAVPREGQSLFGRQKRPDCRR